MRNIKLVLEYDGTDYAGWQTQRNIKNRSIQGTIEDTLEQIVWHKVKLIASGRTDSGVHASGQVVNFRTGSKIPVKNLHRALNSLLPDDISVLEAKDVPLDFHARFSAKSKTYRYLILNQGCPSALLRRNSYFVSYKLDINKMRRAKEILVGRHDFKAFCASGSSVKNTVRTIKKISIRRMGCPLLIANRPLIVINVRADGFLYNMVRSIVGTLIEIGRGRIEPQFVNKILDCKQRSIVGPTAPARGLCLSRVDY